eukprot:1138260-Pelagomonas_calceolata.AAC.2
MRNVSRLTEPWLSEEGDSKEEVPGSNPCGRGGEKIPLSVGVIGRLFLNARGRKASASAPQCNSSTMQQLHNEKDFAG